jgi:hypothetical protein
MAAAEPEVEKFTPRQNTLTPVDGNERSVVEICDGTPRPRGNIANMCNHYKGLIKAAKKHHKKSKADREMFNKHKKACIPNNWPEDSDLYNYCQKLGTLDNDQKEDLLNEIKVQGGLKRMIRIFKTSIKKVDKKTRATGRGTRKKRGKQKKSRRPKKARRPKKGCKSKKAKRTKMRH